MGLFSGIGKALGGGGLGKILGGVGQVFKGLGGLMNSPLGGLLKMIFPQAAVAGGAMNLLGGIFGGLSNSIGGGKNY